MSKNGFAGELCGYLEEGNTGTIMLNCNIGVYGRFSMPLVENKLVDIAENNEVEIGEAEVYTTLEDGAVVSYDARITQVNHYNTENKNLLVEITDEELISKTGGIVQGMSGSPVIQNGMLVGAITHVIVDNPTKGYGIFAETMMDSLENAKKSYQVNLE
jgi:stage IV sporulation protein B